MAFYDIGHILNEIYHPESGSIDLYTSLGGVLNAIYDPDRKSIAVNITNLEISGSAVGTSGWSGYSAYSGFSGYSSYSGVSGYSAYSGFSGYSSYSGVSGYSSFSGYSSYSGVSGYSSYSGYSGRPPAITITTLLSTDSPYSLPEGNYMLLCNCISGSIAITLPTASGTTNTVDIKKIDSTNNYVYVSGSVNDKIDSESTKIISSQFTNMSFRDCLTSTWYIL